MHIEKAFTTCAGKMCFESFQASDDDRNQLDAHLFWMSPVEMEVSASCIEYISITLSLQSQGLIVNRYRGLTVRIYC